MKYSNEELLEAVIDGRAELDENRVTFEALGQKRTVVISQAEIDAFFAEDGAVADAEAQLADAEEQIDFLRRQVETLKEKAGKKKAFKEKLNKKFGTARGKKK